MCDRCLMDVRDMFDICSIGWYDSRRHHTFSHRPHAISHRPPRISRSTYSDMRHMAHVPDEMFVFQLGKIQRPAFDSVFVLVNTHRPMLYSFGLVILIGQSPWICDTTTQGHTHTRENASSANEWHYYYTGPWPLGVLDPRRGRR